jgi:hypothetical protein
VDYAPSDATIAGRFVVRFFRGADASPEMATETGDGTSVEFDSVRYRLDLAHNVRLRLHSGVWWIGAAVGWLLVLICTLVLATVSPGWMVCRSLDGPHGSRLTVVTDALASEYAEHSVRSSLHIPAGEDRV